MTAPILKLLALVSPASPFALGFSASCLLLELVIKLCPLQKKSSELGTGKAPMGHMKRTKRKREMWAAEPSLLFCIFQQNQESVRIIES